MTNQDRTSTCAECKSSFEMVRLDQRFCRRKCRNTFNNRNHRVENQNTKKIDAILHSNRKILEELNSDTSTKEQLLKKGFNFRYITEVFTESRVTYFGCYDFCYSYQKEGNTSSEKLINIYKR